GSPCSGRTPGGWRAGSRKSRGRGWLRPCSKSLRGRRRHRRPRREAHARSPSPYGFDAEHRGVSAIFIRFINRLVPHLPKSFPEGSSSWVLQTFFERLLRENRHIAAIAETGFNTGVSSRAFLSARPDTTVVSFDIGHHPWVRARKAAIHTVFPRRHELVLGDSRDTLRAYAAKHPGTRFDLVFIDGGHEYDVARADLLNFRAMSHDHTVVVMDDLTPWLEWGRG